MKIKFTCNRTGFKKTFTVKPSIFYSYSNFHDGHDPAVNALQDYIQNLSDRGLFLTVSVKTLNQFMICSLES
jgi:hypothetical protein